MKTKAWGRTWGWAACAAVALAETGCSVADARLVLPLRPACPQGWQYSGGLQVGSIAPLPDGSAVAYSFGSGDGPSHIYTVSMDGRTTRQLTRDARADSDVCASADGRWLAFARQDGDTVHLWRMNADGTGQRQLTFGHGTEMEPAISPDGRRIAYMAGFPHAGSTYSLSLINADGTGKRVLTSASRSRQDDSPAFGPTGARLYFGRYWVDDTSTSLRGEVWVLSLGGGGARRVGYGGGPAVSPDGRRIAFTDQPQSQTLGVMNADGTGRVVIGRQVGYVRALEYSPDGRHLLLVTGTSSTSTLWSVGTDGTGWRKIATIG